MLEADIFPSLKPEAIAFIRGLIGVERRLLCLAKNAVPPNNMPVKKLNAMLAEY